MSSTTQYLSCADTAKLVRKALKSSFPGVKFSVRSDTYAGGASIHVAWVDGPTTADVKTVTNRFQGADFDGMQDLKTYREATLLGDENGNLRAVRFGANFIFGERSYSPEVYRTAAETVAQRFGADFDEADVSVRESFRFKGVEVASGLRRHIPLERAPEDLSIMVHRELVNQAL